MTSTLDQARSAAESGSWTQAVALYETIPDDEFSPRDHELKADCLFWLGRMGECVATRQKAYAGYSAAGERRAAAFQAWILHMDSGMLGEPSVSSGWLMRARRDLEGQPDCLERGIIDIMDVGAAMDRGDIDTARALAERAEQMGRRIGSPDLIALGLINRGRILILTGRAVEGSLLLDEAITSVVAGQLQPVFTGWVFCDVLALTYETADIGRAADWTEAARRWYDTLDAGGPFRGICMVHRVDVATLRGDWDEAERQARRASEELSVRSPASAAGAIYALGEINRRRGDLDDAEQEFARAHGLGYEPQPGLARVRLAQGNPSAAAAALRLSLHADTMRPLPRAMMLSAHVEACVSTGDAEGARAACAALDKLADEWGSPMLHAIAAGACGVRTLSEGDAEAACAAAAKAVRLLTDLRMPHDAALARMLLGLARRQAGDEDGAKLDLGAAHAELQRLGARRDAQRAADLLSPPSRPAGLSEREVEVLRFVAAGKTNREIASELVLSEHTVSRHLQNIFRKLDVQTRAAATAWAFDHDLVRPMV